MIPFLFRYSPRNTLEDLYKFNSLVINYNHSCPTQNISGNSQAQNCTLSMENYLDL